MSENNLDKLFQEKLANFQEIPDEKVWNSIAASLDNEKRSRKLVPLWWKVGGVAAILAILFIAINPFSTSDLATPVITDVENKTRSVQDSNNFLESSTEATGITNNEGKTTEENKIETSSQTAGDKITDPLANNGSIVAESNPKRDNSGKVQKHPIPTHTASKELLANGSGTKNLDDNTGQEPTRLVQPIEDTSPSKELPIPTEEAIAHQENNNANKPIEKTPEVGSEDLPSNKKSILEAIEENEVAEVEEAHKGKWSAGPSIAPVYFNGLGEGSPINSILASNSKTGSVTLSYGITVAYEISKKLSVRSGIHKVDYGYDTNDVSFTSSFNASTGNQISNIKYSNDSQSIILNNPNSENVIPKPGTVFAMDVTGKNPTRLGTMGQQMGYLEIPLELNYALLDRKFGVNIIGGVSSLFLTDNSVVLESSGQTTEFGEANNINSINFSTNLGLGLDYKFTPKLKFNVEPVFKYQLNTFSNTSGSFNPYSLGVYSGFTLKF
ncbi:outer membrane beta-barrel protein [Arenibacter troitsensis]|uniref:Outer membrane protein beta-barrel domain-containing protein n=1 Tax=Arenibacter troitsensis TaxID=188872 RepID=A0A1X7KSX5_9FLAO|nr:outer membrane beta-barrel protein [Arenibacter troitsensis]SMG43993.1 hypothetical protein SAMN03080602_03228 [Arenibacter troitsensis]